jgi:hypothetical protein
MDPAAVAASQVVAILSPFLPHLVKLGQDISEEA